MLRSFVIVVVVAILALTAKAYDDRMVSSCEARDFATRERDARQMLVHDWTKSHRPNDKTALPDDIQPSQLLSEEPPLGWVALYTPASGGVAFLISYDRYCNMTVRSQSCLGRFCPFIP